MKIFSFIENDIKITLKLGQNAKENHQLIDNSAQNYWWFHLDKFPSGHCIIECENPSENMIFKAGQIVKENSKYKNLKNLKIKYIQVKFLVKTTNAGEVILRKKGKILSI